MVGVPAELVMCSDLLTQGWGKVGEQGSDFLLRNRLGSFHQEDGDAVLDAIKQAGFYAQESLGAIDPRRHVHQRLAAARAAQHFEELGG